MSGSSTDASPPGGVDYIAVEQSASFVELKRRHRSFVWPLTIAFLVWCFAYVLLSSFAAEFMGTRVWGDITIGLLLGGVMKGQALIDSAEEYDRVANACDGEISKRLKQPN